MKGPFYKATKNVARWGDVTIVEDGNIATVLR
jgi:hypothetical protein